MEAERQEELEFLKNQFLQIGEFKPKLALQSNTYNKKSSGIAGLSQIDGLIVKQCYDTDKLMIKCNQGREFSLYSLSFKENLFETTGDKSDGMIDDKIGESIYSKSLLSQYCCQ